MEDNTSKNNSNMSDGVLAIIGFVSMTFLLFFVAFYMGREIGKNDKTDFEEFTKTLELDRDEMAGTLENIQSKIGDLEFRIGELEGKIDEMREAATAVENGEETGENPNNGIDNPNEL